MNLEERIVSELKERGFTVTTAESCTGGLLAGRILNVSGASEVYNEGHITYSNDAKERILGVSHETLVAHGAVSAETASEMAKGAATVANANVGLSTTGIAGPGGGTPEKPVGLVYYSLYFKNEDKLIIEKLLLNGTRDDVRNETVRLVIERLISELEG